MATTTPALWINSRAATRGASARVGFCCCCVAVAVAAAVAVAVAVEDDDDDDARV